MPSRSRRPTRRSSTISSDATSPSTTRIPRAASCSASSSVRAGMVWEKYVTSVLSCRNSSAWCTDRGPPASTPMARSRTSQPWQYGQCSTSRPHRSRSPGTSGSSSTSPVVTSSRRARTERPSASDTVKPSASRTAVVTSPDTTWPPYDGPPRGRAPAARPAASRRGRATRAPRRPAALRGSPASTTSTERRARASISAPLRPGGATAEHHHVVVVPHLSGHRDHLHDEHARAAARIANVVAEMANWRSWTTTSTRRSPRSAPGCAPCAGSARPRWPTSRRRPASR